MGRTAIFWRMIMNSDEESKRRAAEFDRKLADLIEFAHGAGWA